MPFSLLAERWLPVRRYRGARCRIRPAEIAAGPQGDPVIDFDWGRPDFDAASREFMIGLLAIAFPPDGDDSFEKFWRDPPNLNRLDEAFAPFNDAFDLDGDGPLFGQDLDPLEKAEELPASFLFMDAPGANTIKENKDLFQKRGRIAFLSRSAAAIAAFALQTYAPSGGQGHRTSLRGGGPLTTLVRPGANESLWRFLWLNTPEPASDQTPPGAAKAKIFPWLARTVTSEGNRKVTPAASHPLQAYWGMPRRIRLVFSRNEARAPCPITGEIDEIVVTGFRMVPNGVSYEAFEHPLTPHYRAKKGAPLLPVHPQPGGVPYRDWPSLVAKADDEDMRRAARIVPDAMKRLRIVFSLHDRQSRILATGYDFDNMKPRGFVETEMPLFGIGLDPVRRQRMESISRGLTGAADLTANVVARSVRNALVGDRVDVKTTPFSIVREGFFELTQEDFFERLAELEKSMLVDKDAPPKAPGASWLRILRGAAIDLFEDRVQPEDRPEHEIERAIDARKNLFFFFAGRNKDGAQLYALLELPPPAKTPKSNPKVTA
jgi:CRISPR system Cascade subunit CasA